MELMVIGQRLRELRVAKSLSQDDIEKRPDAAHYINQKNPIGNKEELSQQDKPNAT
jgi:hypothetical protein